MRFASRVQVASALAVTLAGPISAQADAILVQHTRQFGGSAVITELDASGNVVRESSASDGREAVSGGPFTGSTRAVATLPDGTTATATSTYTG